MPDLVLDLKGLKCPLPALRTEAALADLRPGDLLTVLATDPLAAIDLPHLVNRTGDVLEEVRRDGGVLIVRIRKVAAGAR